MARKAIEGQWAVKEMFQDQRVPYSRFLRWIFAPASNSESGHQTDVASHLARLMPHFCQNCQGCHDMVNTCKHKAGHYADPFDAAWWFQATLWAFDDRCEVLVPSRVFHSHDPGKMFRQSSTSQSPMTLVSWRSSVEDVEVLRHL